MFTKTLFSFFFLFFSFLFFTQPTLGQAIPPFPTKDDVVQQLTDAADNNTLTITVRQALESYGFNGISSGLPVSGYLVINRVAL